MKTLVTGGAGFIGRWVVRDLLSRGHEVVVLDDLSNGSRENLEEFLEHPGFDSFVQGDIKDAAICERLLKGAQICYHLGASINVQDSIDDPRTTFQNDVTGTFNVLEACRRHRVRMVFMSTCMVYDTASGTAIDERSPVRAASPYAGSKLAGEHLVLSYHRAYDLPTTVIRPFNTYGPHQKSSGEGGVVSIFCNKALRGETLQIYGDGKQTRDLLYVEDCARFVVETGLREEAIGETLNAATGRDIPINDLALLICGDKKRIRHVTHIHPQAEIARLLGDARKAKQLLDWQPEVSLEDGIARTREWIAQTAVAR